MMALGRILPAAILVLVLAGCGGRYGSSALSDGSPPKASQTIVAIPASDVPTAAEVCPHQAAAIVTARSSPGERLIDACWVVENSSHSRMVMAWGGRTKQPIAPCSREIRYALQGGEWVAKVGLPDAAGDLAGAALASFASSQLTGDPYSVYIYVTIASDGVVKMRQLNDPPDVGPAVVC